MTEVLGAVASIFTLCQAVAEGMSRVIELYRAPAEIKALQEQVDIFRNVLQAVEATPEGSVEDVLHGTLSRARKVIEELHQVITMKLVRQGDGSDRARRRAWMRNKSKIVSLRNNLKDAQDALLVALSADQWSKLPSFSRVQNMDLTRHSRSTTRRVESKLIAFSQEATNNRSMALGAHRGLEDMEDELSYGQSARATKLRVHHESEADLCMLRPSVPTPNHFFENSRFHHTNTATTTEQSPRNPWLPQIQAQPFDDRLVQRTAPASSFELLASFRPETYTDRDTVPLLFSYDNREVHVTEYTRVNQCAMFYTKGPRQWMHLTLAVTTSAESPYWNLARVRTVNVALKNAHVLPKRLNSALEKFLSSCPDLQQDSHLSIYLDSRSSLDMNDKAFKIPVKLYNPDSQVQVYLQEITRLVRYMKCPRYSERQLTAQQPLQRDKPDSHFIANLQSRWVLYFRLCSNKPQGECLLYILQVLHCLAGSPGINTFTGIVLDDRDLINDFLCEIPAKGRMYEVIAHSAKQPVAWKRREKWCRQIVQGVSEIHSKGFVVRCLGSIPNCGVAIDANDDAVLYNCFRKAFTYYDSIKTGVLPPEYHQWASCEKSIKILPEIDIYQLGLLLWQIAANVPFRYGSLFCKFSNCITKAGAVCTESHVDPIQLPSPGEHTPQYLKEVIAACRAESPAERPPTWKLLEMFPSTRDANTKPRTTMDNGGIVLPLDHQGTSNEGYTGGDSTAKRMLKQPRLPANCTTSCLTGLEDCFERYGVLICCNRCGNRTSQHYFHCSICDSADYDICPDCFSQGIHCLQGDHYLRELPQWNMEDRYYTNIKESGRRAVQTL